MGLPWWPPRSLVIDPWRTYLDSAGDLKACSHRSTSLPLLDEVLGDLGLALQPRQSKRPVHRHHWLPPLQPPAHNGDDLAVALVPLSSLGRRLGGRTCRPSHRALAGNLPRWQAAKTGNRGRPLRRWRWSRTFVSWITRKRRAMSSGRERPWPASSSTGPTRAPWCSSTPGSTPPSRARGSGAGLSPAPSPTSGPAAASSSPSARSSAPTCAATPRTPTWSRTLGRDPAAAVHRRDRGAAGRRVPPAGRGRPGRRGARQPTGGALLHLLQGPPHHGPAGPRAGRGRLRGAAVRLHRTRRERRRLLGD